jgi:CRISPR-associated protein Cas2
MAFYLVCFDIGDDRARYRVGQALAEYGTRVQRSVFEIDVAADTDLTRLRRTVDGLMAPEDDCRFYALCRSCRGRSKDSKGERVAMLPAAVLI